MFFENQLDFLIEKTFQTTKPLYKVLTKINGINNNKSIFICEKLGYTEKTKFFDLTNSEKKILYQYLQNLIKKDILQINYHFNESNQIKKYILINHYRGFRHKMGLPVRGQNTHNNRYTQRLLFRNRLKSYKENLLELQINKKKIKQNKKQNLYNNKQNNKSYKKYKLKSF